MLLRLLVGIAACCSFVACASFPKTAMDEGFPKDLSRQHLIKDVPFIAQDAKQCGPASMAMVLNHYKNTVTADQLKEKIFTAQGEGSLQSDMISGARREGYMAHTVMTFAQVAREVERGHPIIVFTNLALQWFPQWHYAVVVGYDMDRQKVYLHSGPDAFKEMDYSVFQYQWGLAENWALVIYPPGSTPASGTELERLSSAAVLESIGKKEQAELAYSAILKQWPESLGAMIGLGNIYYSSERWDLAVKILSKAHEIHPESKTAEHNLKVALRRQNQAPLRKGPKGK